MVNKQEVQSALGELVHSEGWECLCRELKERLDYIDSVAAQNSDPDVALACYRERIGILYVMNRAVELSEGQ